MSDRAPYSRVYWTIRSDDRLASVYPSDANLAAWLRLLLAADMSYPAPADVPASVNPKALRALEAAGVITVQGTLFTFHGLAAERERRRTGPKRDLNGTQTGASIPPSADSRARAPRLGSSIDSSPEGGPGGDGLPSLNSTVAGIWESATGRSVLASGRYAAEYLDDACRRHAAAEVGAAVIRARKAFDGAIPDAAQMVAAMRPLLDPLPDRKAVASGASEEERRAASRRRVQATKAGIHKLGAHDAAPDPACDLCAGVPA